MGFDHLLPLLCLFVLVSSELHCDPDDSRFGLTSGEIETAAQADQFRQCTSIKYLTLSKCTGMSDLSAFAKLTSITGKDETGVSLRIAKCDELTDLSGLENVKGAVPGALWVNTNAKLASLKGLEGVTSFGTNGDGLNIVIWYLPSLVSIAALNVKGAMSGWVRLSDNPKLANLVGLEGVDSWGRGLWIESSATSTGNSCLTRNGDTWAECKVRPPLPLLPM